MSRGKYSNKDQNSKLCNRKRSPSFQRAIIVIVETVRFSYWHLGSIWEGKQNKHWVPLAFPIGSPKCDWYEGLGAPSSPGKEGRGPAGARLGFGSPWTSGSSFCRQRKNGDVLVWLLWGHIVQQLSPSHRHRGGRKWLKQICTVHSQTGFA